MNAQVEFNAGEKAAYNRGLDAGESERIIVLPQMVTVNMPVAEAEAWKQGYNVGLIRKARGFTGRPRL